MILQEIVQSRRYLPTHTYHSFGPGRLSEGSGTGGGIDTVPDGSGDRKQPRDDEDLESSGVARLPAPKPMTAGET